MRLSAWVAAKKYLLPPTVADQVYPPGDLPGSKHCRSPGNTGKIIRQDLQGSQVLGIGISSFRMKLEISHPPQTGCAGGGR
jgi:hypothetical protein